MKKKDNRDLIVGLRNLLRKVEDQNECSEENPCGECRRCVSPETEADYEQRIMDLDQELQNLENRRDNTLEPRVPGLNKNSTVWRAKQYWKKTRMEGTKENITIPVWFLYALSNYVKDLETLDEAGDAIDMITGDFRQIFGILNKV